MLMEHVDPWIVASFMYELKDLSTEEHDLIITQDRTSLQVKELLDVILEKKCKMECKEKCVERFIYALEHTEHSCILEKMIYSKKTMSSKKIDFIFISRKQYSEIIVWTIVIKCWPSSYYCTSQLPLPSLCFSVQSVNKDDSPCLWLAEKFSNSLAKRNFATHDRTQMLNILYRVRVNWDDWAKEKAALASD